MDPIEDAVNDAMLHAPRSTTDLSGTVGALEEVLKGLAYIVGSVEYGYSAVPTAEDGLAFTLYPSEEILEPALARAELLQLLADVRAALEDQALPAVSRAAHLAARLHLPDAPTPST